MTHTGTTFSNELYALAAQYALAADRRDSQAFAAVFLNTGVLRIADRGNRQRSTPQVEGHDQLRTVPTVMERNDTTLHNLGTVGHRLDGNTASGEVYCIAHHLTRHGDETSDHVMFIRYFDTYRR
ncbi:MAG: nuclear transport factor 2 family protein, partial [Acidimicrobiia bacterium]